MKREITSRMINIGFPITLQMIVQYVFSFTDMAFVGNYNSSGLSALTNVMAPYFIFLFFFYSVGQGLTVIISNNIGARKNKLAFRYGENALFFNQCLSLVYFIFWFFFGKYVMFLMGARGEILELSSGYIRILSISFLTFGMGITAGGILQGMGRTMPIFIVIFFKTVLNIFLNWSFIFGKFGFPEFGVCGSALGSGISNILGDILLLAVVFLQKDFKLRIKGIFKANPLLFKKMLLLGIPMGMAGLLWQLGQTVLIIFLNMRNQMFSGYAGVINNIIQMTVTFYWGAAASVMILVSEYRGKKEKENIKLVNIYGLLYSFLICGIFLILFLTFPDKLFRIFVSEKAKIDFLKTLAPYLGLIIFPKASNVIFDNSIRGLGDARFVMNLQIFGTVYIILVGFILIIKFNLGLLGAMFAVAIDEITRSFVYIYRFYFDKSKSFKYKKLENF